MASWTEIPNSSLETGAPARSVDALAFRDNPVAIAEGAIGAPKISNLAFNDLTIGAEKFQTGTTERDWVIARVSPTVYAVGSYIFAALEGTGDITTDSVKPGETVGGSSIRPASVNYYSDSVANTIITTGTGMSGTWRCMGYGVRGSFGSIVNATLFLRIA